MRSLIVGLLLLFFGGIALPQPQEIPLVRPGPTLRSDLYVMSPDAEEVFQLTNNSRVEGEPDWSPDGNLIAFAGVEGMTDIFVINVDGTGEINLTSTPERDERAPDWSPNGRYIAFSAGEYTSTTRPDSNITVRSLDVTNIFVMDADGSNVEQLTDDASRNREPAWSPDGRFIAFVSDRIEGFPEIFIMNADGSNVWNLTDFPERGVYCSSPAWSPDGQHISFTLHRRDEGADLYLMTTDGGDLQRLTDYEGDELSSAWSPDGKWITYVAVVGPIYQLYSVNRDGTAEMSHIDEPTFLNQSPAWSPDGRYIAFQSMRPPPPDEPLPRTKYVLWQDGGVSIDGGDEGPDFRLGIRHADGSVTFEPLSEADARQMFQEQDMPFPERR